MKKLYIILTIFLLSCITISCSKNSDDVVKTSGILKFVAITTNGGINILNYTIKDGSIELFNEGSIEITESQWDKSHNANSGNSVSITGKPDIGETLTIKIFFKDVLIGSNSSSLSGGYAFVSVIIP